MNPEKKAPDKGVSFKDTLNLPETTFPIHPNHVEDDARTLAGWQAQNLAEKAFGHNKGSEKYIINDGPPYTNGPIHLGHAYNKILKDIIGKSQRMSGKHVPMVPVWDCHGLPIEQKVRKEFPALSDEALRTECRLYAQKWITVQKDQFKKLGVLMRWEHPRFTMDAAYEASIVRAFGIFFEQGYIQKRKKTVPWCPTDQTVLASAEIEYKEQKDPSIYVLFKLTRPSAAAAAHVASFAAGKEICAVIWTTTPWTLPLNRAVMIKPGASYDLIQGKEDNVLLLIGSELSQQLAAQIGIEYRLIGRIHAADLVGSQLEHPFLNQLSPIIADDSVSTDEGTAFVHCAPGCGPQDYDVGIAHNLEIFSPVSSDGKYIEGILPEELVGMPVSEGQIWVIKKLAHTGRLLFKKTITHSYPHCWRCRNPLIFRATNQWFCNLNHKNLREQALKSLDKIGFFPKNSRNFLRATLEGRLEWCLSRQRTWGTPIPALVCADCNWVYTNKNLIDRVAQGIERDGLEYWHRVPISELGVQGVRCAQCCGTEFLKEQDILDVWFDSGVSHSAVLKQDQELAFPADLYIEGVDQHRGWFQSSLLTSMVLEGESPTKAFLTHGFVVDEKGHKMSKSLGNVIEPDDIIKKLGTDGLRLWVASLDHGNEAVVSRVLLENIGQVYRKIRNTCRFLLANIYDFNSKTDFVSADTLLLIDQYALHELSEFNSQVRAAYDAYELTKVYHLIADFCTVNLSSLYLDIIKDRLYTASACSLERRSAQTACYVILDTLTRLCAPILSFMAEQVSDVYQKDKKGSIHLQNFNAIPDIWKLLVTQGMESAHGGLFYPYVGGLQETQESFALQAEIADLTAEWDFVLAIRSAVLKAIEALRAVGVIKHSLEVAINIGFNFESHHAVLFKRISVRLASKGMSLDNFLKEVCIVSQCKVEEHLADLEISILPGLFVRVQKADGQKCPRCWQWTIDGLEHNLCGRCFVIVKK